MARSRSLISPILFVVVGSLLACNGEPAGKPVALSAEESNRTRADRHHLWVVKRYDLLGVKLATQTWNDPLGLPKSARLQEALFATNQAITIDRACLLDESEDCKGVMEKGISQFGTLGHVALWRNSLTDDLSGKGEILNAMKAHKAALVALDESVSLAKRVYNSKKRGDALYELGRWENALEEYQHASTAGPYVKTLMGLCEYRRGRHVEAKAFVETGLCEKPELRNSVPGLATAAAALGL